MSRKIGCVLSTVLACLVAIVMPAHAQIADWPSAGEIRYDVMRGENGLKLGEGRHVWAHDGNDYRMQTELETTGLAGLLYSFSYVQSSRGRMVETGLQPHKFVVDQSDRESESATFDWESMTVRIERRKDREDVHELAPDAQDLLSIWHLVATRGLEALPESLAVVNNRRVSEADVERLGEQRLRLPLGQVDTTRVRIAARSGKLTIDMWLSKAHHLLPLRVLVADDDGQVLDQQAVQVELKP